MCNPCVSVYTCMLAPNSISHISWETFLMLGSNALTWWVLCQCRTSTAAFWHSPGAEGREMRHRKLGEGLQLQVILDFWCLQKCVGNLAIELTPLLFIIFQWFWQPKRHIKCKEALVLLQQGGVCVFCLGLWSGTQLQYPDHILNHCYHVVACSGNLAGRSSL